jgi:hypothetical protein
LAFDDPLTITAIAVGVIIVCGIVVYAMRMRGKKEEIVEEEGRPRAAYTPSPFKVEKSVDRQDAVHAKDELRILDLEREILSDAIRRLYEAHAEGKITEEERERLAQTYKTRMMTVKDAISKDESLVALHELETMQEDLIQLFSDRFDELNTKIGEMRSRVDIQPVKEIELPSQKEARVAAAEEKAEPEERARRKKKPTAAKPSPRTEAEKRIEEIRAEVEKVLDRLGQMEVES